MSLIKISGGFDFTPYLAPKGYEIVEDAPVEKSSKLQSTGFNSKVFGTYGRTAIKMKFKGGMNNTEVAACLAALKDVMPKGLFEYWSPQKSVMRKANFFIDLSPVNMLTGVGTNVYMPWEVALEQADLASNVTASTINKLPTLVNSSDGTWSNPTYICAAHDSNYATTAGSLNVDWDLVGYGFGASIPTTAKINIVAIGAIYKCSTNASVSQISFGIRYKGTQRGVPVVTTYQPLDEAALYTTNCGVWTPAELNSNDCQIFARVRRKNATACTYYFDYFELSVNYTEVG